MSSRSRGLLADLLVSGSVAALATWWWHQYRPGGLLFGVLAGLVLMWRRRYPIAVALAVSVLTGVTATIEVDGTRLHDGMLLITVAVAMYAVIVHAATLRRAVAGGVATWLFSSLLLPLQNDTEITLATFWHNFGLVFGYGAVVWAAALSVRYFGHMRLNTSERRLSAEREQQHLARIAVAEERARIARELHDIVAHSLSVIILQANGAAYAFDRDRERAREALRTIGTTGTDALEEIRQLVELLRGDGDSPPDRVPVALNQLDAVVQRARDAGLTAELVVHGTPPEVPGGVALAVCRIVQESLTNTLKHAGPDPSATVTVSYQRGSIDIEVTDSGRESGSASSGGHGLIGMRERVALYGGTFAAGRDPGGGWRVHAGIPLTGAAARAVTA
ncbi:ATPase [Actinoplanes italicus]|uniref:histidine kinase n=1 Tax=Actinoplanes italicus TaxID=113567 RepID=A0A2T0KB93_9ACTN|nr:histidine kinase [Actinoplanes italicus]PRX20434.1 signal transduction histidine kinase [Actinoplanes italicus]GIE36618.1 ATPase [Actinoplanes italicus]